MSALISPSILSADFSKLADEIQSISDADMIHVDVMDSHFVPNLTIGLPVVERLQQISPVPLDVHLMISDPDRWAGEYAASGVASVTFHLEAASDPIATIDSIRRAGAKAALAIKPATGFEQVIPYLGSIEMLLVMTVEPGFGGQKLIPATVSKIRSAREYFAENSISALLQVDGGVTEANISELAAAGADCFVAGTAVFSAADRNKQIARLRELAATLEE